MAWESFGEGWVTDINKQLKLNAKVMKAPYGEIPNLKNYHFRDDVSDGRMVFDYTVNPGPSPTTNALRIMRMEGLPI